MYKSFATILLFFVALVGASGQEATRIQLQKVYDFDSGFSLSFSTSQATYEYVLEDVTQRALRKYHPDTVYWLEKVFYMVHRRYLKTYSEYPSFSQLINTGTYDCMTGTMLYAQLFEKLKIPFDILEFPYHTSLIIKLSDREYMIEATDPRYGFVTSLDEIQDRIKYYRNVKNEDSFHKIISGEELLGLYFYNQAVKTYNRHSYYNASLMLKKANALYPCERTRRLYYQLEMVAGKAFVQLASY